MKAISTTFLALFAVSMAQAGTCPSATLQTYLNAGVYSCTESSGLTAEWNQEVLVPSYAGLSLLSSPSSIDPSDINVVPGSAGFNFNSNDFTESTPVLGAQAQLVHFTLDAGLNTITSTNFALDDLQTSAGPTPLLGAGLAVGQELLCLGGEFTSLPTGVVTTLSGVLTGNNAYGCTGVALIGSVGATSGLTAVVDTLTTGLGLGSISSLSNNVTIDLSAYDPHEIDIIKLQVLASTVNGSASDTGFGNTYAVSAPTPTPEPASFLLFAVGGVLIGGAGLLRKLQGKTGGTRGE